jgi:hypothetical protein
MKKYFLIALIGLIVLPNLTLAVTTATRLKGRILLQVQQHGEAWYVRPEDSKRYYLKDGSTAYQLMRSFGLGVSNADLNKIPVGFEDRLKDTDTDHDGLSDQLEDALGTKKDNPDSDGDGHLDGDEVRNGYSPLGPEKIQFNSIFINGVKGKILLQVESHGEAWYVTQEGYRYYLKDGQAAYQIMRYLSLGVSDADLNQIASGTLSMPLKLSAVHSEMLDVDVVHDACIRSFLSDADLGAPIKTTQEAYLRCDSNKGLFKTELEKIKAGDLSIVSPDSDGSHFQALLEKFKKNCATVFSGADIIGCAYPTEFFFSAYLSNIGLQTPDPNTAGWKQFVSNDYNFSFRYPSDWTVTAHVGEEDSEKYAFYEIKKSTGERVAVIDPIGNLNNNYAEIKGDLVLYLSGQINGHTYHKVRGVAWADPPSGQIIQFDDYPSSWNSQNFITLGVSDTSGASQKDIYNTYRTVQEIIQSIIFTSVTQHASATASIIVPFDGTDYSYPLVRVAGYTTPNSTVKVLVNGPHDTSCIKPEELNGGVGKTDSRGYFVLDVLDTAIIKGTNTLQYVVTDGSTSGNCINYTSISKKVNFINHK